MRYVNWKKTYEIGIKEIDEQHKKIFEIVNEFFVELFSETYENESSNILMILEKLKDYCKFHFDFETNMYSKDIITEYFSKEYVLIEKIDKILISKNKHINIVSLYSFAEYLRQWVVRHVLLLNDTKFKETLKNELISN
ncbi:MAG: hypothetical protein GXO49_08540 [Chlorobi bacterium]|nr:hypothetical protein [Chlorobiota bacterium]